MYDQLDCGRSTHLPEKKGNEDFWTVKLFLAELDNLLSYLEIQGDYDLFGQSWGGSLAAEHAVRRPKGLKRLIITNSPASSKSNASTSCTLKSQDRRLMLKFDPRAPLARSRQEAPRATHSRHAGHSHEARGRRNTQ